MEDGAGQGLITDFLAVLTAELANPPDGVVRAMAQVLSPTGTGDHLGLLVDGRPDPGSFMLLESVIHARTRPRASFMLEWVLTGRPSPRHYLGWAIWREAEHLTWRRLTPDEIREHPGLYPDQRLGADPLASFA
jgi:hypothetical protein